MPVTLRFWFCSTDALDKFLPEFDEIWDMEDSLRAVSKVEIMFYERNDRIAYLNKAAAAGAKTLQVLTEADGRKLDDKAITEARRVSKARVYRRVDPETTDFWEKSYFDEEEGEGEDQGNYSDEESCEGNKYSDEESEEESDESDESDG